MARALLSLATICCVSLIAAGVLGNSSAQLFLPVASRAPQSVFDNAGSPWPFLSQINAVNYDTGGQGVAYSHTYIATNCTAGQSYRPDFTNFNTISDSGATLDLGCTTTNDFYSETVSVSTAGPFVLNVRAGDGAATGATWAVIVDGNQLSTVQFTNTGGYQSFLNFTSTSQFNLSIGTHTLKLKCTAPDSAGFCGDIVFVQGQQAGAGIACAIGPNFLGTIPAAASTAGFTTCVANYDFTRSVNFNCSVLACNPSVTYNFATLSTWLGGNSCVASSPLWWNTGYNSAATPCSDFSIVTDSLSGKPALQIIWTPADSNASAASWMAITDPSTLNQGVAKFSFPQGVYVQDTWRSTAATQTALTSLPTAQVVLSFFTWFSGNTGHVEWDYFEAYTDGGMGSCIHDWTNGGAVPDCAGDTWASNTSFSPNQEAIYHTTAALTKSNGSTRMEMCTFLDGNPTAGGSNCGAFTPTASTPYTIRNYFATGVGSLTSAAGTFHPSVNEVMFIQSIQVFSCAGWASGQCNTSVP
jgi:hypothetical protein